MNIIGRFYIPALLISLFLIPLSSEAIQRTVTSLADSGAGSLRNVIASASGGDEIVFAVPLPGTINLLSEIPIQTILTITGPGAEFLTLDGGGVTRIFNIDDTIDVTISGLRFFNGFSDEGGAIRSEADNLIINDCIFDSNHVSCEAQDCQAEGGAIKNSSSSFVNVTNTLFTSNSAYCTLAGCSAEGGVLDNGSGGFTVSFTGCTFEFNEAECIDSNCDAFGGVYSNGGGSSQQSFLNCTFFDNTVRCEEDGCSARGGSIADGSSINPTNIDFCTFSSDTSECTGAGCIAVGNSIWTSNGPLTANSNIFFNTSPDGSCDGSDNITSIGYNLDSGNNCLGTGGPGDQPFIDPRLFPGPPLNNGGLTPTIALFPNSPAIDAGNPACPPPDTDQRGFVRPQFERCDSGAYEFEGQTLTANIPTLGEWAMLAMFLVLGVAGYIAIRKRYARIV